MACSDFLSRVACKIVVSVYVQFNTDQESNGMVFFRMVGQYNVKESQIREQPCKIPKLFFSKVSFSKNPFTISFFETLL